MLRIDVDHPDPGRNYGVPKDNPFVDRPGARPELWAYGLRNPWRLSFDRESGQLWVGNNGQDLWEQVYLIRKGANYGWSVSEGSHAFRRQRQAGPDPISPPAAEHPHSEARSLTGGRVYRGTRLPDLVGAYVYGDWSTGRVWGIKHDGKKAAWHRELVDTPFNITGFGTDHAGELYVIDQVSGFYRLEPTTEADRPVPAVPDPAERDGPVRLGRRPQAPPGRAPVSRSSPRSGPTGRRWSGSPRLTGLERIEQKPQLNAGGAWTLPDGSVLVQTPQPRPGRRRRQAGPQAGRDPPAGPPAGGMGRLLLPLERRADRRRAGPAPPAPATEFEVADPAAPGGRREQVWRFPAADRVPGLPLAGGRASSWASPRSSSTATATTAAPSTTSSARSSTSASSRARSPGGADDRPRLVNPYDAEGPAGGPGQVVPARELLDLPRQGGGRQLPDGAGPRHPARRMHLIDEPPVHADLEIPDARLVAPGSPERSVLYQRISRRGDGQMPPLVSTEVDREAVELIADWIRGLKPADR